MYQARALVLFVTTVALASCTLPGEAPSTHDVAIAGSIVDGANKRPLGGVHIVLQSRAQAVVAFTNDDGVFAVLMRVPNDQTDVDLQARSRSYRPLGSRVSATGPQAVIGQLRMEGEPAPASAQRPRTVEKRSGPRPSGFGAGWSEHVLCPDPAEPGYAIAETTFRLEGDRACGNWSQCDRVENSCWRFRLQGHNELPDGGVRLSEGVMTVIYKPIEVQSPQPLAEVFLQYAGPWSDAQVEQLRQALQSAGFACPSPVRIESDANTDLKWFRPEDRAAVDRLQQLLANYAQTHSLRLAPPLTYAFGQAAVRSPQFELWLGKQ